MGIEEKFKNRSFNFFFIFLIRIVQRPLVVLKTKRNSDLFFFVFVFCYETGLNDCDWDVLFFVCFNFWCKVVSSERNILGVCFLFLFFFSRIFSLFFSSRETNNSFLGKSLSAHVTMYFFCFPSLSPRHAAEICSYCCPIFSRTLPL